MPENREWSEADLQRLADDKVGESLQLEFKGSGALSKNPDGRAEIAKDVSAMANAAGGTIIYGIAEKKTGRPILSTQALTPTFTRRSG